MTTDTVLLVGTQKGLFRARPEGRSWHIEGPLLAGYEVLHAWLDPRDGRTAYAATQHPIWGAHLYHSEDGGRSWVPLPGAPSHPEGEQNPRLRAIWYLTPAHPTNPDWLYAGIDPAGLFLSRDRGLSWVPVPGINHHPSRDRWEPARGGFSLHSIKRDPENPQRLYVAVSAGGVFRSNDGGDTWVPINRGVRAENRPERYPEVGHNVHRLVVHPRRPGRLYRQCYNGVYRSDDAGDTWTEISDGLPSDFGYALVSDPYDADTVYQIPIESSHLRTVTEGRLRVYRSRDAGRSWQPLTHGLPQEHAYVTVLREAIDIHADAAGMSPMLAFGTSGGHLFVSHDGGESWDMPAGFLPRILSVKIGRLEVQP